MIGTEKEQIISPLRWKRAGGCVRKDSMPAGWSTMFGKQGYIITLAGKKSSEKGQFLSISGIFGKMENKMFGFLMGL